MGMPGIRKSGFESQSTGKNRQLKVNGEER
jgi:hypothetical protein